MNYRVETNQNGYVEILEVNGKEYLKRWEQTEFGATCEDDEFYKQLEADGVCDYEFLDMVCNEIDDVFFANAIYETSKLVL